MPARESPQPQSDLRDPRPLRRGGRSPADSWSGRGGEAGSYGRSLNRGVPQEAESQSADIPRVTRRAAISPCESDGGRYRVQRVGCLRLQRMRPEAVRSLIVGLFFPRRRDRDRPRFKKEPRMPDAVSAAPANLESIQQAAERLGRHAVTIQGWRRRGWLNPASGNGVRGNPFKFRPLDVDKAAETARDAAIAGRRHATAAMAKVRPKRHSAKTRSAISKASRAAARRWRECPPGIETIKQAAERVGRMPFTIREWIKRGELPVLSGNPKGGYGGYKVRADDVDNALERISLTKSDSGRRLASTAPKRSVKEYRRISAIGIAKRWPNRQSDLLTADEVVSRTGLDKATVYRMCRSGELPAAATKPLQFTWMAVQAALYDNAPKDWVAVADLTAIAGTSGARWRIHYTIKRLGISTRKYIARDSKGRRRVLPCVPKAQRKRILDEIHRRWKDAADATPESAPVAATPAATHKPAVVNLNDERDAWLYHHIAELIEPAAVVIAEYGKIAHAKGWAPIKAWRTMTDAVDRFADRKNLASRPRRKSHFAKQFPCGENRGRAAPGFYPLRASHRRCKLSVSASPGHRLTRTDGDFHVETDRSSSLEAARRSVG